MGRYSKRDLFLFAMSFIAVGVTVGLVIAARLDITPKLIAASEVTYTSPFQIEDATIRVAAEAGKSVVSISAIHINKSKVKRYYFRNSPFNDFSPEDEPFNRFFGDFFGDIPQKQLGLGSGVIIDKDGYILTNEHVVEGADKITVTLSDGREFKGKVKGIDPRSDLAVIKIDSNNLPVATLGDSNNLKIGQWVLAIGNPFGFMIHSPEPTVTLGVAGALHRALPQTTSNDRDYSDVIQTDAAINPGNSGGPLVNLKGEVVGISVAIFSTTGGNQGVGFAIPINVAKKVVNRLIAGKKILYGWLGVSIQDINEDLAKYFNLKEKEGVIVGKVFKDSPAEKGGMRNGDIIISFAGEKIKNVTGLVKIVGNTDVGKKVKIEILRDNNKETLDIAVGERPQDLFQEETGPIGEVKENNWRGLSVTDLSDKISQQFKLEKITGVVVIFVEPASPADDAGIMPGDIISQIGKQEIKNIEDFNKATKSAKGDILIKTDKAYTVIKSE